MSCVTVHFDNDSVGNALRAIASARGCRPQQLAVALVKLTLDGGMVDAVLDGEDPAKIAPNAGRRQRKAVPGGGSPERCRVLATIAAAGAKDGGMATIPLGIIASSCGCSVRAIRFHIEGLIDSGFIMRLTKGGSHRPATYAITLAGRTALVSGAASSAVVHGGAGSSEPQE